MFNQDRYAALLCFYSLTNRNVAVFRAHGKVFLHRQVFSQGNVPLTFRLRIERTFSRNVTGHHQVTVLRNQVCIFSRSQFPIHAKGDVILRPIRVVVRTGGFHRNVSFCLGSCGNAAVNCDLAISRLQRHFLFSLHRIISIRIVADMDVACGRLHSNVALLGFYGFFNIYVAVRNSNVHIVRCNYAALAIATNRNTTRAHGHVNFFASFYICAYIDFARLHSHVHIGASLYVSAYRNVARTLIVCIGGQGNRTVNSINGLIHFNVTVFRAHGKVFLHRQVFSQGNVPLTFRLRIERTFSRNVTGHHQVTVLRNQVCIFSRSQFPIHAKGDVILRPIRVVVRTGGFHRNVSFCLGSCGNAAVNCDLAISRLQRHFLFSLHRIISIRIVADMDVACGRLHSNVALLGFYGFFNIYAAIRNTNIHIVRCDYAALTIAANRNTTRAHGHVNFVASFYICAYSNVASSYRCTHIRACSDTVINVDFPFTSRQRYSTFLGFYGFLNVYIAIRNSNVHIVRCNYTAGSVASYRNGTRTHGHVNFIAGLYICAYIDFASSYRCVHIRACSDTVVNVDVPFAGRQRYSTFLGFYGFLNVYVAIRNSNVHIVRCDYAAVSVATYRNGTRTHGHVDFITGLYICAYIDFASSYRCTHIRASSDTVINVNFPFAGR